MQHPDPRPSDAELFAEIGRQLGDDPADLSALTRVAARRVPGAQDAGITRSLGNRFVTIGATSDAVSTVDRLQYELGTGPCVDAVVEDAVCHVDDLNADARWPEFGRRAVEATGVRSMLSIRLFVEAAGDVVAALNLYSREPAAFDTESNRVALIVATHAGFALTGALVRERVADLEHALTDSREIGVAVGIVMARHRVTREQAFDLLRMAGQRTHRRVADVAADVITSGDLPPRT